METCTCVTRTIPSTNLPMAPRRLTLFATLRASTFFAWSRNLVVSSSALATRASARALVTSSSFMYPTLRLSGVLAKSASLAWMVASYSSEYHAYNSLPHSHTQSTLDRSLQRASRPYSGHWWLLGPDHGFDSCPPRLHSLRRKTQVSRWRRPTLGFSVRDLARPPRCQHDEWL